MYFAWNSYLKKDGTNLHILFSFKDPKQDNSYEMFQIVILENGLRSAEIFRIEFKILNAISKWLCTHCASMQTDALGSTLKMD